MSRLHLRQRIGIFPSPIHTFPWHSARRGVIMVRGAKYLFSGARVGAAMYDLAFIADLFASLPADAQQEILELAAQLAGADIAHDP